MNKENLAKILTYLGSIPFIFFTLVNLYDINFIININPEVILKSYAVIIICFISGIHFGYAILQDRLEIRFLVLSNIVTLAAWFTLLLQGSLGFAILSGLFLVNLFNDFLAFKNQIIEKWFFDLRIRISLVVIFFLILNCFLTFSDYKGS